MEGKNTSRGLQKRIREGKLRREDVAARLAALAFGPANDCVRLVLEEDPPLEDLDLSNLCELRRSEKGAVEVKLVDRLQALERLLALTREEDTGLEEFLTALQGGAK